MALVVNHELASAIAFTMATLMDWRIDEMTCVFFPIRCTSLRHSKSCKLSYVYSHASRLLVWLKFRGRMNIGNSIILGLLARYVEDSSVHISHAIEPSISVMYLYTHSI